MIRILVSTIKWSFSPPPPNISRPPYTIFVPITILYLFFNITYVEINSLDAASVPHHFISQSLPQHLDILDGGVDTVDENEGEHESVVEEVRHSKHGHHQVGQQQDFQSNSHELLSGWLNQHLNSIKISSAFTKWRTKQTLQTKKNT